VQGLDFLFRVWGLESGVEVFKANRSTLSPPLKDAFQFKVKDLVGSLLLSQRRLEQSRNAPCIGTFGTILWFSPYSRQFRRP